MRGSPMIIDALHRHATERGEQIAIEGDARNLTWRELEQEVTGFADWLTAERVSTLAFELNNGPEWIVTDLAAMKAGVRAIPIPSFFSSQQLGHTLTDADVDILLTDSEPSSLSHRDHEIEVPLEGVFGYRFVRRESGDLQRYTEKVTYTSGSTGNPKGVRLGPDAIAEVTASIVAALQDIDIDRHLCLLPMATLLENIAGIYAPIVKGIRILAPDSARLGLGGSSSLDVQKFGQALEHYRPDSVILVPQLLLALTTLTAFGVTRPDYLRMIAVGGGHVGREVLKNAEAMGLPVFEGYGLSECCSVLTLNTPQAHRAGSVGKPLCHASVRISDSGEIEVAGAIMRGYVGSDLASGESSQWYSTGDLGYLDDDGFLYISGRRRNVFITAYGRNVSPEWIEAQLTAMPVVAQALVHGEGREHNLALLWLRGSLSEADLNNILEEINSRLPDYARVHEAIVVDEAFDPSLLTSNGRLRRDDVTSRYQALISNHYTAEPGQALA